MGNFQASKNYGWASSGCSILSEIGTMHLEFTYLSDITGNPVFKSKVENVRKVLKNLEKPKGLYPNYIHPKTGKWGQREFFFFVSLLFIRPEKFFVYRNICSFEPKNSFLSHFCVSLKVTDISPCNRIIWAPCICTEFQFLFLSSYVSLSACYSSSNPRKKPNHLITIINLGHTWYPASPE